MIGWISEACVDLCEKPLLLPRFDYTHNPLRASQLLFSERVRIVEETKHFFLVEAIEQPRYCPSLGWHPYPGWVAKKAVLPVIKDLPCNITTAKPFAPLILKNKSLILPFGACLYGEDVGERWEVLLPDGQVGYCEKDALRPLACSPKNFISDAKRFLGCPYLFGGRGTYFSKEPFAASVDCSGLVSILFRAQGIITPRDAHDQSLQAKRCKPKKLKAGDLVFLQPLEKTRVSHVIIYLGEETFIEAPESGKHVRLLKRGVTFFESENTVRITGRPNPYTALYGSFWPTTLKKILDDRAVSKELLCESGTHVTH